MQEKVNTIGAEHYDVPFKKILCANRGEIAIRVFRAADELGIKSVGKHFSFLCKISDSGTVNSLLHFHELHPWFCCQVAIYSPADRLQPHRFRADESYCVGTPEMKPVDCYLDVEGILALAKKVDVDAIHPGYGFLSENTEMARRCAEEGIKFIGPDPDTIEVY